MSQKNASPRKPQSMIQRRYAERGNMFLALFGAVAIIGVLGATIMSVMRGPLSTMVEVNRREQAKAEVSLGANLVLAGASDRDAAPDGYTEAPSFAAGTITGGGVIPATIGAIKTDPWGTPYGYCVWNHGPDMPGQSGLAGTLDGTDDTNNIALAVISAGPDRTFQTTCVEDQNGTNDYIEPDEGGGDDIVKALSYNEAVGATDGLWTAVGVTGAEIDRNLTVTSADTSSFTGSIAVASTAAIITDSIEPIDPATIDYVTFSNGIRLGDVALPASCDAAGDAGTLRFNGGSLQFCNGVAWESVDGDIWTDLTGGRIHYGTAGTEQVGIGTNNPDNTLDVAGTLDASGAVTFGSTLDVTGNVAVNTNMFTIDATNGNTVVAGTLDSTGNFAVNTNQFTVDATNGNTTVGGTLDVTGNVDVNGGMFTVDASNGDTVVDGQLTVNADAEITDSLLITSDTADGSTNPLEINDSGNSLVFRVDSNGGILGEGLLDINGGAQIDPQLTITSNTADGSTDPLVIRDSGSSVVFDINSNGDADAAGTIEANDYSWAGNDFTPGTCASGNFNRWDGTEWVCEADTDGGYVAPPPTPGGANTQVQFNNAGVLDGDAGMTWNDTSKIFATQNMTILPQNLAWAANDLSFIFEHMRQGPNSIRVSGLDASTAIKRNILTYTDGGAVGLGPGNINGSVLDAGIGFFGTQIMIDALTEGGVPGVAFGESGSGNGNLLLLTHDSPSADTDTFYIHTTKVANASFRPHLQMGGRTFTFRTGSNGNPFLNSVVFTITEAGNIGIGDTTPDSGTGGQLRLDVEGSIGGTQYCDENGNNCFEASAVGAAEVNDIDDLTDAYTIYDAGTTSNFIMGRTGAAALTAGAVANLFIGERAGATTSNSTAATDGNTAVGFNSLNALTSGAQNTGLGTNTMRLNTTGSNNTAIGFEALQANVSGSNNTALGQGALYLSTGSSNVAVGATALLTNTTGGENIAIGSGALLSNQAKSRNTAIGHSAMRNADNTTSGSSANNTAVGYAALDGSGTAANNTGTNNVSLGALTMGEATSGSNNTVVGTSAGDSLTTGSSNILIGYNVDTPLATTNEYLNIGGILLGDIGTTSTDPKIGAHKYCDENLANCFTAASLSAQTIDGLTDAYAVYGTTNNLIMGRTSAAALTAGAQFNTFIGENSGATSANSTGTTDENTTVGYNAGRNLTSGNTNVALGAQAMRDTTTGGGNTAVGQDSLRQNTTGSGNTALGVEALLLGNGNNNIGIGIATARVNSGSRNIAIGYQALLASSSGSNNISIGDGAGDSLTTGSSNILIGNNVDTPAVGTNQYLNIGNILFGDIGTTSTDPRIGAHKYCDENLANCFEATDVGAGGAIDDLSDAYTIYDAGTTSNFIMGRAGAAALTAGATGNLFIGELAGATTANSTATTDNNIAVGYSALRNLTSGNNNTAVGYRALIINTTGNNNAAMGMEALYSNTTGVDNAAMGMRALLSNTTGSHNAAMGWGALYSNTTGGSNAAMGYRALISNTTGSGNAAMGRNALYSSVAKSNNTAIGYNAMYYADPTATPANANNTAVGYEALRGSTTAADNTGVNNVALGYQTMLVATSGSSNVALGHQSLLAVTSGANNVVLGANAGSTLTTGSANILIGTAINTPAAGSDNRLNIGDSIYGDLSNDFIGIGEPAPSVALDVNGDIEYTGTITDVSDARLKKDIVPLANMLAKISSIKTYSFVMKDDKKGETEFGVMAQELETVFPELVKTASDDMGTKSVNYVGLIAPMIDSLQTLKAENEMLKAELKDLSAQVALLNKATGQAVNKAGFAIENWITLFGISLLAAGCFFMGRRRS